MVMELKLIHDYTTGVEGELEAQGLAHRVRGKAMTDHHAQVARAMSEKDLQQNTIDLAMSLGWMAHAERPARTMGDGWRTPIQGHAGFPDAVLARCDCIYFVEFKSQRGKLSPAQDEWRLRLDAGGWVRSFVWRPSDWLDGTIERVLRGQE